MLTNDFEMVENVFGATLVRARTAPDGHPALRKYFRDVDARYVSLLIRQMLSANRIFRFPPAMRTTVHRSDRKEREGVLG